MEFNAPFLKLLNDTKSELTCLIDSFLIKNTIIGNSNLFNILLGCGVAGNHSSVHTIHTHRNRTTATDIRFFQNQNLGFGVALLSFNGCHAASRSSTDHQKIYLSLERFHQGVHATVQIIFKILVDILQRLAQLRIKVLRILIARQAAKSVK